VQLKRAEREKQAGLGFRAGGQLNTLSEEVRSGAKMAELDGAELLGAWELASDTGCPFQRFTSRPPFAARGAWLSLSEPPPCHRECCGMDSCHNFGRRYEPEPGRFFVVALGKIAR
jgi:hypothetical protein